MSRRTALETITGIAQEQWGLVTAAQLARQSVARWDQVYSPPDHISDKLCAIVETTERRDGTQVPSTRYKDLVDLALIAAHQPVNGSDLRAAVLAGTAHRQLPLPTAFAVPAPAAWRSGYAAVVGRMFTRGLPDYDRAVDVVSRFLNPVLSGPLEATWDPIAGAWVP